MLALGLLTAGCGEDGDGDESPSGSDKERIRQVVEESDADWAQAHDREPEEWCDTRLVLPRREVKDLFSRLEAGSLGPREQKQLQAAANEARCLKWAEAQADELEKVDEGGLEETDNDPDFFPPIRIRGRAARATLSSGEGEDRSVQTWLVVKLSDGDWRVLQNSEVPTIVPAPD
jgi:hypothetical protein